MPYITQEQWSARFGADEFAQLTQAGVAVFTAAVADADAIIDAHLAARYALPLAAAPALLVGLSGDLSRYRLYDESPPEVVAARRDAALETLRALAKGDLALPGAQGTPDAAAPVLFDGYSAPRLFTQDTMSEFAWQAVG